MQKTELLCIGHRGAMGHAPENTLASIRKALELGASYIEIDVYYVDGQLVVFHDDRLERVTNGTGFIVEQCFDYLRSLDAGNGELIPTLEEVCATIQGKACLNIELKGPNTAQPVAIFIQQLVRRSWSLEAFLVSSFDHRELVRMKRLIPDIKLGALICGIPADNARFAEELGAVSVNPCLEFVDTVFVEDAHARGLKVYVYTVNETEEIRRVSEMGVDGVFTNFPERVLGVYSQGVGTDRWN